MTDMTDEQIQHHQNLPAQADLKPDPSAALPMGFRSPPHNIEAEQALLGAIMINNQPMIDIAGWLRDDDFYEPVHGRIYANMLECHRQGRLITAVTLKNAFDEDEALANLDGSLYLANLAQCAETILNGIDYARLIRDLAQRRRLAVICQEGLSQAMDQTGTMPAAWTEIMQRLGSEIDSLNTGNPEDRSWNRGEILRALMAELEDTDRTPAISTGLLCLDKSMDGGVRTGCSYCIEGQSGTNKSTMLNEINEGMLQQGIKTHFFTMEQSPVEIMKRIVSSTSPCGMNEFESPERSASSIADTLRFYQQNEHTLEAARYDHVPGITIDDLLARMTRSVIEFGTQVFFLDYFTKIEGYRHGSERPAFYERCSDRLDNFITANNVALVMALQLNRHGETLWTSAPKQKASWRCKIRKVEIVAPGTKTGVEHYLWAEVDKARHSECADVGSEDDLPMKIVNGPRIVEV